MTEAFDEIVRPMRDAPPSFLSPAERKKRRPKIDQLMLGTEPDHSPELEVRAGYTKRRGAAKRDAFRAAVHRQQEREKRERDDKEIPR
jgi:hypothetical protein